MKESSKTCQSELQHAKIYIYTNILYTLQSFG